MEILLVITTRNSGKIAIPLMQQLYTTEKVFRVVQPNNSLSEYVINKQLVDDKTDEIQVINDITIGKYDVIVVAGSTLPSNRYAELEFYMDAYQKGIIDRQEVLKKTEVFDMEGVMQRTDMIAQLQGQLQQAQDQIKKLSGDLQTRDREAVHLRKAAEVEKFKGRLKETESSSKAEQKLQVGRLSNAVKLESEKLRLATEQEKRSQAQKDKRDSKQGDK